jgi:molecular chaperone DnaK (HSP70)
MTRPDLDAILAKWKQRNVVSGNDVPTLLRHIDTLEHMLAEERENVDTLRARVAELEAEVAVLRPWSVMLKRAHGALTDAGCVVPLEFDQSIEHAIKDLARRATRAEQLFVDEYDARKAADREIAELKARITTLEAMR